MLACKVAALAVYRVSAVVGNSVHTAAVETAADLERVAAIAPLKVAADTAVDMTVADRVAAVIDTVGVDRVAVAVVLT